jgi:hypothetical protein
MPSARKPIDIDDLVKRINKELNNWDVVIGSFRFN